MKRHLFTILSALSLLLFVAVVLAWVGSAASSSTSHQGRTTGVHVSTAFRAIEIAIVENPLIERDDGNFHLRRGPAIRGIYVGPVPPELLAHAWMFRSPDAMLIGLTSPQGRLRRPRTVISRSHRGKS